MKRKRLGSMLIILMAALGSVWASGTGEAESGGEQSDDLRIAFIPQLIGIPYFTAMEEGGKAAAEMFGGEFLYIGATQANAAEQVRLIENLITQEVDAISISVLDEASINPVISRARREGIAVYTSDSDAPGSERQLFVAQALNEDLGATLIDRLAAQIGETGQIGIVSGESTATNLNTWIEYMEARVAEAYPQMEIVDIRYTAGGSTEDALRQAQELMTRYPEIAGLIAVASTTVPGVAHAVEEAGRAGEIAVIGYGSPNTVRPYIESGVMAESILWDPFALGYLTHWAGIQLALGNEIAPVNTIPGLDDPITYDAASGVLLLGPPLVINADNVNTFDF
ncbi:MAG: autoinducer 2 ABC transporter substrate-binding protein [Spirochaetales bacterium]|nr:autoinducer 2 ABC transporter substrate-binding protein [Spirochaetales bacterium]